MPVGWTKDETIIVIAKLLQCPDPLSPGKPVIREISQILQNLPVIPEYLHVKGFRTEEGVGRQVRKLKASINGNCRDVDVGQGVYNMFCHAKNAPVEVIEAADAILRCAEVAAKLPFGGIEEIYDFPEGAILFHTHRYFERRDGKSSQAPQCCQLCGVSADLSYSANIPLIEPHLMVPPTKMQPTAVYKASDFIYVCPNCHRALHLLRPWRSNVQECETILYE